MINAIAFQTVVEVEIYGIEIRRDTRLFQAAVPRGDRYFHRNKNRWIVRNPHRYAHLPYIKAALEERAKQPELFPSAR